MDSDEAATTTTAAAFAEGPQGPRRAAVPANVNVAEPETKPDVFKGSWGDEAAAKPSTAGKSGSSSGKRGFFGRRGSTGPTGPTEDMEPDDNIPVIPDLDDVAGEAMEADVSAPTMATSKVQTLGELDAGRCMAPLPPVHNGIDLTLLQSVLMPPEQVNTEGSGPWTFDSVFASVSKELTDEALRKAPVEEVDRMMPAGGGAPSMGGNSELAAATQRRAMAAAGRA